MTDTLANNQEALLELKSVSLIITDTRSHCIILTLPINALRIKQIGVVTGTLAGRETIKTEGNEERISKAIRAVSVELAQRTGSKSKLDIYGKKMSDVGEESKDRSDAPGEGFYGMETVDDQSRDDGSSRGALNAIPEEFVSSSSPN